MGSPAAPSRFQIHWVLVEELALGPAPRSERHLDRLADEGVRGVLSLCSLEEAAPPPQLENRFICQRLVLPDHRCQRLVETSELEQALELLADLRREGPVFVHCLAAMERSPLVCLAWLMRHQRLSLQRALDYLMQLHPGTCPLPEQLAVVQQLVV